MTDQEKKRSAWDTLAQELGADAKPLPPRPAPAAPSAAPTPRTEPLPVAPPVEKRRTGWEELTSWLGIGGGKKARPEQPAEAAAPQPAPPSRGEAPHARHEQKPRRESAFRQEPLPRPEGRPAPASPAPEARAPESRAPEQPSRREETPPRMPREEGPTFGSRGREFDDFGDALQEEQAELRADGKLPDEEALPAREGGGDSARRESRPEGDDRRPRRRRRRGGRGRGRGAAEGERGPSDRPRQGSGGRDEPRREPGRPAGGERAEFHDDHDDLASSGAADEALHDEGLHDEHFDDKHFDDAEHGAARPAEAREGAGEPRREEGEPRRRPRRRRRRGGRNRAEGSRPASGDRAPADAVEGAGAPRDRHEEDDDHDDDVSMAGYDRRIMHDSDDAEHAHHDADADGESDQDVAEDFHHAHKGIPTWDEAVGIIINANLEARVRNPHSPGGQHRGGGRNRGGRRDGRH